MSKKHRQSNKARKRKGRDLDEILEDLKPEKIPKMLDPLDKIDLPGYGDFKCKTCDRHFIDEKNYQTHLTTKLHKRQIKRLQEPPYTQAEADLAGGLGPRPT
uniref:C2H2-type domain-containing protein n=1 Tax=Panagrellus redivivus TaxID=6233 RepID=A0A7E4VWN3_PANRE